ncbi:kinase-like domain-containing protein [Thelephora terrestris]|uniref:Kinase-like domain-containing protein n=1 Tax=Thelephora terrestris TaxID=56493 RepID=A0A9P6HLS7_9AGAM|nr:kinase-like domain-containing protein [Thelephora terrestris]
MSTSQVLQHLYSLDTSSPDLLRYLYYLIQNDDEDQYLSSLQGSELTRLVDFLDGALDVIPITDDVSRRCLHKLQAICGRHKILPSSYNIPGDLTIIDDDPVAFGGFSDVWEGTYDGKKVCIKRLRITQQTRKVIGKAFCKEAVMWKRLKHPNIVGFIGVTQKPLRFVSEWMPNGTLTEYLSENPGANRIGLLLDVAEGLTFLHAIYTTHGDLKGPNVLIDHTGHARLTDFGFTSVVRGVNSVLVTEVQGYSARWAAPEVLENGDQNTREADVFAFGMIVIEVFTGSHPFSEFTALVAVSKIIAGERPDRPQEPGLTDIIWDMTLRSWTQDPAHRPTMASVVGILRECSRSCTPSLHLLTSTPPEMSVYDAEGSTSISVDGKITPSKPSGTAVTNHSLNLSTPIDREPTLLRQSSPPTLKGYLQKYTNVVRGYSTRWFVLKDGTLSYYRDQEDENISSRGSIAMKTVVLKVASGSNEQRFEIHYTPSRGHQIVQKWYLKADHPVEGTRWTTMIRKNIDWYKQKEQRELASRMSESSLRAPSMRS